MLVLKSTPLCKFAFSDFSLKSWLSQNNLNSSTELVTNDYQRTKLLEELAISQYFDTSVCSLSSLTSSLGWTSCKYSGVNHSSSCSAAFVSVHRIGKLLVLKNLLGLNAIYVVFRRYLKTLFAFWNLEVKVVLMAKLLTVSPILC